MDDESGPPGSVGDLDARRAERAGAEPNPQMPEDLREMSARERQRLNRQASEDAKQQPALQRWMHKAGRPR